MPLVKLQPLPPLLLLQFIQPCLLQAVTDPLIAAIGADASFMDTVLVTAVRMRDRTVHVDSPKQLTEAIMNIVTVAV